MSLWEPARSVKAVEAVRPRCASLCTFVCSLLFVLWAFVCLCSGSELLSETQHQPGVMMLSVPPHRQQNHFFPFLPPLIMGHVHSPESAVYATWSPPLHLHLHLLLHRNLIAEHSPISPSLVCLIHFKCMTFPENNDQSIGVSLIRPFQIKTTEWIKSLSELKLWSAVTQAGERPIIRGL